MRKISAMYEWSGGTDYMHLCVECRNCKKYVTGKRTTYKCKSYGDTEDPHTNWNPAHIACRAFNQNPPEIPVYSQGTGKRIVYRNDDQIDGQMTIADFIGI